MGLAHMLDVLRRHPRPARLVAARFLQWTGLSPLFTVQLDGYRLRFYPTNVSGNLWINPGGRFHSLDLFKDYAGRATRVHCRRYVRQSVSSSPACRCEASSTRSSAPAI